MQRKKVIRIISAFLLFFLFLPCVYAMNHIYGSASTQIQSNDVDIEIRDSAINITFKNKAATSDYRWETIGWVVTTEPLSCTSTTVSNMTDFMANNKGKYAILRYDEGGCTCRDKTTDEDREAGLTRTQYEFNGQYVLSRFDNIDFEELSNILYYNVRDCVEQGAYACEKCCPEGIHVPEYHIN